MRQDNDGVIWLNARNHGCFHVLGIEITGRRPQLWVELLKAPRLEKVIQTRIQMGRMVQIETNHASFHMTLHQLALTYPV